MTTNPVMEAQRCPPAVPRYGLIPVHGYDITVATVLRMLDGADGGGTRARILQPGEPLPFGVRPVLVTPSTVYGTVLVETMLRGWPVGGSPRPWLVVAADVPAPAAPAARYRLRALGSRLAGIAHLPYLPVLRTVAGPEDALKDAAVLRAAANLCRVLEGSD